MQQINRQRQPNLMSILLNANSSSFNREIHLKHRGGGDEPVTWADSDEQRGPNALSLSPAGVVTVRGVGDVGVRVALANYGHVRAYGR